MFFLLTGPERCIFLSTCKQIFTGISEVLFWGSALHVHSFSQWVSMLPKIIHKIVETSDGPSSYGPSSYGPSVFTDDTRLQLERKGRILSTASSLLTGSSSNVRELAQFVGQVVSCFQGVKFGPL